MAAKLVERLHELLGGAALRLQGSRWSGMREVLRGEEAVPGEEDARIRLIASSSRPGAGSPSTARPSSTEERSGSRELE
jgi:hypothetical protein